jgi:hypothetical protein
LIKESSASIKTKMKSLMVTRFEPFGSILSSNWSPMSRSNSPPWTDFWYLFGFLHIYGPDKSRAGLGSSKNHGLHSSH